MGWAIASTPPLGSLGMQCAVQCSVCVRVSFSARCSWENVEGSRVEVVVEEVKKRCLAVRVSG
jgi:hypothetical protein